MIRGGCDSFNELCALVSAGAATPEEERALRAHLATGCNPCTAYLRLLDETVSVMVDALSPQEPPPAVRQRLLDIIAQETRSAQKTAREADVELLKTGHFPWFGTMGWALAALLVVVLMQGSHSHTQQMAGLESELQRLHLTVAEHKAAIELMKDRETQLVAMQGEDVSPHAMAKAFWNAEANAGLLIAFGLPPLQPDKVYQLWAIQESAPPVDAGIFTLDSEGIGTLKVKALPHPEQPVHIFAITLEPAGGSTAPTSAIYIKGAV